MHGLCGSQSYSGKDGEYAGGLGLYQRQEKDPEGTIDDAESAERRCREVESARAHLLCARALLLRERFAEARESLNRAVSAGASSESGREAQSRLDRWETQVDVYRRWSDVSQGKATPEDSFVHYVSTNYPKQGKTRRDTA